MMGGQYLVSKVLSDRRQRGVGRAAYRAAVDLGLLHDGYSVAGARPFRNVVESVATLIVMRSTWSELLGGRLAYVASECALRQRPCFVVLVGALPATLPWVAGNVSSGTWMPVLNVEGPSEDEDPGIEAASLAYLLELLR